MIGYLILAVLVAFIAVVAIRTIRFRPKPQPEVTKEEIAFDRDAAVDSLAQLVRCKTVSYNDHSLEDEGEFQKLISLLPTLYPNVFGTCTFQQLPDRALLLRWPGKQEGDPAVMMAHYDVVPVNEEKWDNPPFAGIIEDGILWGRGTLDTKVTFNGVLSAANYLIGQGFQPVCGFSYGAGKFGRVREAFWFCVKVVTVILVVLCVISLPFSGQIIALFRRDDPQVIEIGTFALRLQLLTLPLWGYITMCNMFTQAIGYGVRSTIISTARQGIFLIPALLIFPRVFGLLGIQISQPVADICTLALCIAMMSGILRQLKAREANVG